MYEIIIIGNKLKAPVNADAIPNQTRSCKPTYRQSIFLSRGLFVVDCDGSVNCSPYPTDARWRSVVVVAAWSKVVPTSLLEASGFSRISDMETTIC